MLVPHLNLCNWAGFRDSAAKSGKPGHNRDIGTNSGTVPAKLGHLATMHLRGTIETKDQFCHVYIMILIYMCLSSLLLSRSLSLSLFLSHLSYSCARIPRTHPVFQSGTVPLVHQTWRGIREVVPEQCSWHSPAEPWQSPASGHHSPLSLHPRYPPRNRNELQYMSRFFFLSLWVSLSLSLLYSLTNKSKYFAQFLVTCTCICYNTHIHVQVNMYVCMDT